MICYLVVSTALLGSPHVMPEMWLARDEATLARVAASRGPGGAWLEFIDLKRGRIGNGEVRRRWSKSKGKSRQRDEDTEVAPSKSRRATPTKVRAEVVGVSVPDTPEGVRDLAATNPGDSPSGAQREQQTAKEELRRHQMAIRKKVAREEQRQRDRDHYLRVTVPLLEVVERQRQADRVKWAAEREAGKPSPLQQWLWARKDQWPVAENAPASQNDACSANSRSRHGHSRRTVSTLQTDRESSNTVDPSVLCLLGRCHCA